VCDEFWLVGRGKVGPFDGDLDDYQKYLLDEAKRVREAARAQANAPAPAPVAPPPPAVNPQQIAARTKPLKKELAAAEQAMAKLQAERQALEDKLARPLPAGEIAEAGKQFKAVVQALETAEERWLSLSGQIEAIEKG
jgi:ATP-binding cassette subfamily F protein 3